MHDAKTMGPIPKHGGFDFRLALVCVVALIVSVYSLSLKADLHNDEYTTYIIANNAGPGGMVFSPEDNVLYDDPAQPYLDAMTVPEGGGFNYAKVWENDQADTLPPLHYALLHTICSFFPGQFSIWFAGVINLVFLALSIVFLNKLLSLLRVSESGRLLTCLLFGVLPGIVEIVQFLRMYTMVMFWVIWLSYGHARLFQSKRFGIRQALAVALPTIAGVLSHYYFILFAVFQCLVAGIWLLSARRWKDAGFYILTFVMAAAITIGICPDVIRQIFHGWLTPAAVENLTGSGDFIRQLNGFFFVINTRLFGGFLPEFGLGCLIALLMICRPKMKWPILPVAFFQAHVGWLSLLVPSGLYFVLMTKIAFFANTRYMCMIYPLLLCMAVEALMRLLSSRRAGAMQGVAALLCSFVIFSSYQIYPVRNREYTGYSARAALSAMEQHADLKAACVYTTYWMADNTYQLNKNLNGLVFIRPESLSSLTESISSDTEAFLLEIETTQDQEAILGSVIALYPQIAAAEPVTESTYYTVYLLQ